jgi:hypothetical protein
MSAAGKLLSSARVGTILLTGILGCTPTRAQPDQTIALDLSGPRPTAQLFIGSRPPVTVIFDTGAGANIVGTALAKALGLPDNGAIAVGSPGATAPLTGFVTAIPAARLGEATIDDTHAVAIDLPMPLPGIAGVISPNSFSGRLVRFEFARGRAIVMDKTQGKLPAGEASPYGGEMGHSLPAAEIDVAGTKMIAHLDSGSRFALCLPFEVAKQVPLKGKLVPIEAIRMTGAVHAAFAAQIDGMVHIGPLTLTDPQVVFEAGAPFANVGIKILKQMTLVLDPEEKRSWMLSAQ